MVFANIRYTSAVSNEIEILNVTGVNCVIQREDIGIDFKVYKNNQEISVGYTSSGDKICFTGLTPNQTYEIRATKDKEVIFSEEITTLNGSTIIEEPKITNVITDMQELGNGMGNSFVIIEKASHELCDVIECFIYNAKNDKIIVKEELIVGAAKYDKKNKIFKPRQSNLKNLSIPFKKSQNLYYVRCRIRRCFDGEYHYSSLSQKYYVSSATTLRKAECKISNSKIKLVWNKLPNVRNYTVYVTKAKKTAENEEEYDGECKVKTTKGNSCVVTKIGRDKINTKKYIYYISVVCKAKYKGDIYPSKEDVSGGCSIYRIAGNKFKD